MYVLPYDAILKNIGMSRAAFEGATEVTIPTSFFKFLLQFAAASGDFNESGYLAANPDIRDAMRSGAVTDPRLHYIGFGYFEGRRGGTPEVDEDWYRRTYPDVGAAVRSGKIPSAKEHFEMAGAEEFRAPNKTFEPDVMQWKKILSKNT